MPEYKAEYRIFTEDMLGNTDVNDYEHDFKAENDEETLKKAESHLEMSIKRTHPNMDGSIMKLLRYIKT